MLHIVTLAMVYLGSALMVYNIYSYSTFARKIREKENWAKEFRELSIPIVLLVLFLFGYLAVGIFGNPDLIVSGILFGGSIFVFIIFQLLMQITSRIQEYERLEGELRTAEAGNRAKSNFLSSMSHEMRTPMNVILGLDHIALLEPELPDHTRDELEKIGASAEHLLGLINDVLDMNQIESGNMPLKEAPFSLRNILNQVNAMIESQCKQKGLEFAFHFIGEPDDVFIGDDLKLKRVLINILGNAVKYTNAPGKVTFTVEQVKKTAESAGLSFNIMDTGIGIDKEFLPRLFDVFAQEDETKSNKLGGSGLGLAISKSIVEMMDGEILVSSKKGAGSVFVVNVTLKPGNVDDMIASVEEEAAPLIASADFSLQDRRILLAEDMELNAEVIMHLLKAKGAEVEIAEDGQTAVEKFTLSPDGYYDAILMDVRMPVIDGLTAAKKIRSIDRKYAKTVPIIALTANAFDDDVQKSIDAGMNEHLTKPVEPELLYKALSLCIK